MLIAVLRNRKTVRSASGVFEFFNRSDKGWKRRPGYARWVSDVLIVHYGPALIRTEARRVAAVTVDGAAESSPKKLDEPASQLVFVFADETSLAVAVADSILEVAQGTLARGDYGRGRQRLPRSRRCGVVHAGTPCVECLTSIWSRGLRLRSIRVRGRPGRCLLDHELTPRSSSLSDHAGTFPVSS